MISRPYPKVILYGFLLTLLTLQRGAQAQRPVSYQFTGTVTSVEDTHNWLQNTYAVGAPITGTVTYFSSGVTNIIFGFPQTKQYAFSAQKPGFSVNAGGQEVKYKSGRFAVTVTNDGADPNYDAVGDTILFEPNLGNIFPSFFTDPSTEPGFEDFLAFPFAQLRLYDPAGTALSSNDLPLSDFDLSAFSVRTGQIGFFDGNGEFPDDYARAVFRIDTLQATPEPGSLALLCTGATAGSLLLRRRRTR